MPENIGLVARAMDNCGLKNLILINPREEWPNEIAINTAANSKSIIYKSKIYTSIEEALMNFHFVVEGNVNLIT